MIVEMIGGPFDGELHDIPEGTLRQRVSRQGRTIDEPPRVICGHYVRGERGDTKMRWTESAAECTGDTT